MRMMRPSCNHKTSFALDLLANDQALQGVANEVNRMMQEQSVMELDNLQEKIDAKLQGGTAQVVEYWAALLKSLQMYKAKAWLREVTETYSASSHTALKALTEGID